MLHDGFGPTVTFEVYGSVRHGLAIETSDIDVVVLGLDEGDPDEHLSIIHSKMQEY